MVISLLTPKIKYESKVNLQMNGNLTVESRVILTLWIDLIVESKVNSEMHVKTKIKSDDNTTITHNSIWFMYQIII